MKIFKNLFNNENKIWGFILAFTVLPFIFISFFAMPMGDDFHFGDVGRNNNTINAVKFWCNNWNGRYTSDLFLTIFNPLSYNCLDYFWLPPLALIFGICLSVYILIKTVGGKEKNPTNGLIILTTIVFLILNLMPEIGETLYWLAGAYTYQTGNIFFILLVAIVFRLTQKNSIFNNVFLVLVAAILIFLIAGTNEISMAYVFGCTFLYAFVHFIIKPKKATIPLFLFVTACVASYISITSPGNFIRASSTGGLLQNIPKAFLESALRGSIYIVYWLPSALIMTIIIWKQLGKVADNYIIEREIKSKEIYLVLIVFLLVIVAGFFPSIASTGKNAQRTIAPILIVFILSYFGIVIYYYQYFNSLFIKAKLNTIPINYLGIVIIIFAFSNKHNVMNAYEDIVSLKVTKYHKVVKSVYEDLANNKKDTIYVMPLFPEPNVLPKRWPNPYNHLVNKELEMYFHKKVEMVPNL